MSDFSQMNNAELRAYVLSHRQDEQAWTAFMERLKDAPNVISVSPNLDEAGWAGIEQLIVERSFGERRTAD